jgi:hypothetical protein
MNAFVSTLLYPFWAYALGSPAFTGYWDGNLAAIMLASVTVVSGLFSPTMPRSKRRREREVEDERPRAVAPPPRPQLTPAPVPKPEPLAIAAAKK